MRHFARSHGEKLGLAGALALVLVATGWWWRQRPERAALRRTPVGVALTGAAHEPIVFAAPEIKPPVWTRPAAQSRGAEWRYELFTPPNLRYDAVTRAFTVAPSAGDPAPGEKPSGKAADAEVFGLELLAVKREPYRLQLVGYAGAPGDYLAAFVSSRSAETFLARPGRRFAELGLTFERFAVEKLTGTDAGGLPALDIAALAVLRDEQTGEEITLDDRARRLTDVPVAVLRLGGVKNRPRELRLGDTWQSRAEVYRLERIQLDPPEVVVARQTPGSSQPELRVLRPVPGVGGSKLVRQTPALAESKASVATSEKN